MKRLLALVLLFVGWPGYASIVTGPFVDPTTGTAHTINLEFDFGGPIVSGTNIFYVANRYFTATNGNFAIKLGPGNWQVLAGPQQTAYTFALLDDTNTYPLYTLLTNGVTFTYPYSPSYVSKIGDSMIGNLGFATTVFGGLILNNLTAAQMNAVAATNGMLIFNTDAGQVYLYSGGWAALAGGGGSQTPWAQNINGAGFALTGVGALSDLLQTNKVLLTASNATFFNVTVSNTITGTTTGNLTANQTITASGDATGSGTTSLPLTLKSTGTAGTYQSATFDAQGRETSGGALTKQMIPQLDGTNIPTGNVNGATNFIGSLTGDVTGTQGATVVSQVGGVSAANVATGANAANGATIMPVASKIVLRNATGDTISNRLVNTFMFPTNTYFSSAPPNGISAFTVSSTSGTYLFTASQPVITRANGWVSGLQIGFTDLAQYWVIQILNTTQFLAMDINLSGAHSSYSGQTIEVSPVANFCSDDTDGNEGMTIGGDGSVSVIQNGGNSAQLQWLGGANTWVAGAYNGFWGIGHLGGAFALGINTNAPNGELSLQQNYIRVRNPLYDDTDNIKLKFFGDNNGGTLATTADTWSSGYDVSLYLGDYTRGMRGCFSTPLIIFEPRGIQLSNTSGTVMTVGYNSGANVGIGTTTPAYFLDVAGTLRSTGSNTFAGTTDQIGSATNRSTTLDIGVVTMNAGLTNTAGDIGNAGTTHLNGNVFITAQQTNIAGFGISGGNMVVNTPETNVQTLTVLGNTTLTGSTNTANGGVAGTLVVGGNQTNIANLNVLGTYTGNGVGLTNLQANALAYTNAGVITSANSNQIINASGAPKVTYTLATNMQIAGLTNGPGGVRVSFLCYGATNHSVTVPTAWKEYGSTNIVSSLVSTNSVIIVTNGQGLILFLDSLDGTANPAAANTSVTMGESNN